MQLFYKTFEMKKKIHFKFDILTTHFLIVFINFSNELQNVINNQMIHINYIYRMDSDIS